MQVPTMTTNLTYAAEAALISERALHAERFELFLQPICSLHENGGLTHYEVLLRLRTASGGLVQPGEFFARAAHQRLMPNIDRWVVSTLLVWLTNNRNLWMRAPSVFSINLSAQSITDDGFIGFLEACVIKSGLPPQALCFDITERFASSGSISVAESMKRIEALGCEVALDDSELQAVCELGVDYAQGYLLGKPESLTGYDFSEAPVN
jgi:EAL domain-containing protein (putative c-di-GMP-specific phosphodiesterase class I)